jgi:putative intracellular protease/amidase
MRAHVLLYDGFDELDAIGPFEVLANAAGAGADLSVRLVTATFRSSVTASHGLVVTPDALLPAADVDEGRPDLLVVPGGGWTAGDGNGDGETDRPGARREAERGEIPARIAALHDAGTTVAGV